MAKAITAEDENNAQELRDLFTDTFTIPDGWEEERNELPIVEAYVEEEMPDDYLPQFQIAGYVTENDQYVRVWWLRQGERLQVSYEVSPESDEVRFGGVGGVEAVVNEIENEL
jgi:hypothetical protein